MSSLPTPRMSRTHGWSSLKRKVLFAVMASPPFMGAAITQDASASTERQGFTVQSYDDDFSADCGANSFKCTPVAGAGYVSFGGRLREQVLEGRPDDFGLLGSKRINATLLHRLLVHADWHASSWLRVFGELGDHLEAWRPGGPRPTDKDKLDVQQAFIDLSVTDADASRWMWRVGRQQITLGNYRLVAPRENANILIAFNGSVLQWEHGGWTLRAIDLQPVLNRPGVFNDVTDPTQKLTGLYATHVGNATAPSWDIYELGFHNTQGKLYRLSGDEQRQSYGARLYGKTPRWDYDIEPIIQHGNLGGHPISAWAFFSTTGYTFADVPWTPRLGLRADYASGSAHPGLGTSGTFHPLIGPSPLLTDANLNTAANLIAIDPSVQLHVTKKVKLGVHLVQLWRASTADAFYGRGQIPIIAGNASTARHIGSFHRATLAWDANRYVDFALDVTRFKQGAFAKAGHALAGNYVTATANLRF